MSFASVFADYGDGDVPFDDLSHLATLRPTRYLRRLIHRLTQPWPLIEKFLKEIPPGSVGLDVGCGNGKYLGVNSDIFMIGSDRYMCSNYCANAKELQPNQDRPRPKV